MHALPQEPQRLFCVPELSCCAEVILFMGLATLLWTGPSMAGHGLFLTGQNTLRFICISEIVPPLFWI